ncbi:MAG: SLC13 family permease [Micropruina glycogenica]
MAKQHQMDVHRPGSGNPTVIFIATLFVVSDALDSTGVTAWAGQQVISRGGEKRPKLLILICLLVALLTALISVNGAVAALIPVVVVVAIRVGIAPARCSCRWPSRDLRAHRGARPADLEHRHRADHGADRHRAGRRSARVGAAVDDGPHRGRCRVVSDPRGDRRQHHHHGARRLPVRRLLEARPATAAALSDRGGAVGAAAVAVRALGSWMR